MGRVGLQAEQRGAPCPANLKGRKAAAKARTTSAMGLLAWQRCVLLWLGVRGGNGGVCVEWEATHGAYLSLSR